MAKQELKPLSWIVTYYDFNRNKISYYDVLKYRKNDIKKMRKKCKTKEEFSSMLRSEMMYSFWSKCEWELILTKTEDNHIILTPWCGCKNPDEVAINVTNRTDFNWGGFADYILERKGRDDKAKIDVWDQIEYRWEEFLDYVWNYHFKYQRKRIGE